MLLLGAVLLGIAAAGGGWLALDRVDPLLAVPGIGWAVVAGALPGARGNALRFGTMAALVATLLLAAVQWAGAGWFDPLPTLLAGLLAGAAAAGARFVLDRARQRGRKVAAAGLILLSGLAWLWQLAAWPLVQMAYREAPTAHRPEVLVLTSLPLFAVNRGSIADLIDGRSFDAPAVAELQRHVRLVPTADVSAQQLAGTGTLLLAHPGALPPETLVAIDSFVRRGGHAVVLADALVEGEAPFALGDPRNPPVSTLLDPLLAHWGLAIAPARGGVQLVHDGRHRLMLISAGSIIAASGDCPGPGMAFVSRCSIARGRVTIVGDADFLDPALWSGSSGVSGPAGWQSANISWLADELRSQSSPPSGRAFARPVWTR